MKKKAKSLPSIILLFFVIMFNYISPNIVLAETIEAEVGISDQELILAQTDQAIDLGNGMKLLEGMYLFGIEEENEVSFEFSEEKLVVLLKLVTTKTDDESTSQNPTPVDNKLEEIHTLEKGTQFYSNLSEDKPQIELTKNLDIALITNENEKLGFYLGEIFFYLKETPETEAVEEGGISEDLTEDLTEDDTNALNPINDTTGALDDNEILPNSKDEKIDVDFSNEDVSSNIALESETISLKEEVNPWEGVTASYFEVMESRLPVYNSVGSGGKVVGLLVKGQTYPVLKDEGNWLRIQFGNTYGYVAKEVTRPVNNGKLNNINTSYKNLSRTLTATERLAVYDNSSGQLVPFGTIEKGTVYPVVSDFGSNWIRVIFANRVGYVYSGGASVGFTTADKYFKANSNIDVYDNRTGSLVKVGELTGNQVYQRVSDYGTNWHQIQFGDHFGYISKSGTSYDTGDQLNNINVGYSTTGRKFTASERIAVYDNTSGSLVPFGIIDKGVQYPITSDYAANWWRVVFGDRVGYIYKDATELEFTTSDKYFKANANVDVYDNRSGSLVKVGELTKNQVYERRSDYGSNWHQIQFGDHFGYVYKESTSVSSATSIRNKNTNYKTTGRTFEALERLAVYDNTSGSLVQFGTIDKGSLYPIATDYAANWWRVVFGDRIGYVAKNAVDLQFTKNDKYFKANSNLAVYDNRTGSLVKVGELSQGEAYERVSDYGSNWHQIQFGNIYGYVSKPHTSVATKNEVRNQNSSYTRNIGTFTTNTKTVVYDNSTGKLIPFGLIESGNTLPIVTDFGNWWRVIFANRVGYVYKNAGTAKIDKTITIYLDPGHGGIPATGGNPGPVYNGVREQDLNLNISLQVRDRLEKLGYRVVMSRENDLNTYHNKWEPDLYARPAHANAIGADLLVSVHHNAHPASRSVSGIETYIYGTNSSYPPLPENKDSHDDPLRISESRKLANAIHKDLIKNTGANDRGVQNGAFIVVREAKMPAVLLELGFMSNPTELSQLRTNSYQQKLINGIVSGIHNYFLI